VFSVLDALFFFSFLLRGKFASGDSITIGETIVVTSTEVSGAKAFQVSDKLIEPNAKVHKSKTVFSHFHNSNQFSQRACRIKNRLFSLSFISFLSRFLLL
jgi:hypothetical protein